MGILNSYILLIEDGAAMQESLSWVLEGEDYKVMLANNGQAAFDYLKTATPPALILLDLIMPVMNGYEFLERQQVNTQLADIPVIIITADQSALSKIRCSKKNSFLCKPLDLNVFLDLVKDYMH